MTGIAQSADVFYYKNEVIESMNIELHLQEGKKGAWELRKFTITEKEAKFDKIRCFVKGHPERAVKAGEYWELTQNGYIYMTNTPAEVRDHYDFVNKASGKVLIAGLGIGLVIQALLDRGKCERITVVEKSQDVIDLVGPFYTDPRVDIVCSDIFDYKPKEHFDYAWFDIWPDICADNYDQMKRLHYKFARSVTHKDSWCREVCKRLYKQNY